MAGISTAVCNSEETTREVRKRIAQGKRVIYIPNSVSMVKDRESHRRKWRKQLGINNDDCLVLGVGRLSYMKNFERFIEAIAAVRRKVSIRAVVAGRDDGCLKRLQLKASALGLNPDMMRFIGAVPDARELMCAADIFVLSSDYEGMPNVVLEAMAAGVPCVSTRVNGVSDLIVSGENGFVTDHLASALAEKVKILAADVTLRQQMGIKARLRVGNNFNPRDVAERMWRLLD
jgi:glycosyltransferase involved in cell wall biosynthesis